MSGLQQLYILGEFDVDRLHAVVDGRLEGRACGHTFATLMLMLGEAQLGDSFNKYLYVGEGGEGNAKYVMKAFAQILEYEGFKVTQRGTRSLYVSDDDVTSRVMSFMFMPASADIDIKIAGAEFNKIFFDVSRWGRAVYDVQLDRVLTRERNT